MCNLRPLCVLSAGLLAEIEAKASQPEYAQLLQDCRNMYCSIRQQVRRLGWAVSAAHVAQFQHSWC